MIYRLEDCIRLIGEKEDGVSLVVFSVKAVFVFSPSSVYQSQSCSCDAIARDLFQITQTQTRIIMGRGRNTVIGSLTSLAVIGASGYCVWRFALGSPTTVEEAEQGAKDLWEKAKNFDFDDFTQVLEDGLEGLDFGSFFDSDPR